MGAGQAASDSAATGTAERLWSTGHPPLTKGLATGSPQNPRPVSANKPAELVDLAEPDAAAIEPAQPPLEPSPLQPAELPSAAVPKEGREDASGRPQEPKPMPHQDELPEILVDPFQDDVRAERPNRHGGVEQSSGVQPKPFPMRGGTRWDAGSLKAKFETAKRLNASKSESPQPIVLPTFKSNP